MMKRIWYVFARLFGNLLEIVVVFVGVLAVCYATITAVKFVWSHLSETHQLWVFTIALCTAVVVVIRMYFVIPIYETIREYWAESYRS